MRKILTIGLVLTILFSASAAFAGGIVSDPIVVGPGTQFWASSDGTNVAFTQIKRGRSSAFVMTIGADRRFRLHNPGVNGAMGSLIAGTGDVLFQQWDGNQSGLWLRDATGIPKALRGPVQSPNWEYWPVASQRFVLFDRLYIRRGRVTRNALLLFERDTGRQRVLVHDAGRKTIFPGFAGNRYAAWTECGRTCMVWIYDGEGPAGAQNRIHHLPLPPTRVRYAPAIDEISGRIYFVQSGNRCGANVRLLQSDLDGSAQVTLAALPSGIDTGWTLGLTPNGGSGLQDLFYERWDCRAQRGDVFAFRSVDALVPRGTAAVPTGADRGVAQEWGSRPPLPPGGPAAALHGRK